MDKRPERSLRLSREPAITGSNAVADRSSRRSIGCLFTLGDVDVHARLFIEHR